MGQGKPLAIGQGIFPGPYEGMRLKDRVRGVSTGSRVDNFCRIVFSSYLARWSLSHILHCITVALSHSFSLAWSKTLPHVLYNRRNLLPFRRIALSTTHS